MNFKTKSCLLITYGPVPTPQYQTVEGGGMRVWGLAKGLKANGIGVVVGVNNSFPQNIKEHEGIRLINWGLDDKFASLINSYDAVIISYCMGDPSVFVADNIKDNVQLILDAYVPIYVEVSARESHDIDNEYRNYMADVERFNHVLKRGDYFLCANEAQKTFYTGVLSGLGIVNPRSYREDRILVVPFGIHDEAAQASENPYEKLGITKKDFVVLWFGGIYPWFHIDELLEAILSLSKNAAIKFVFVGGKNPFNPNPDFSKQYEKAVSFAEQHKLNGKSVFFVDWVNFEERINWYKHANVVISLNQPGEENRYSWRTRVMDFVWGELPIITNGGDPLSEDLIEAGAAIKLPELTSGTITKSIERVFENQKLLDTIQTKIKKLKPDYYWQPVTRVLKNVISQGLLPYSSESSYRQKLRVPKLESSKSQPPRKINSKLGKIFELPMRSLRVARRKGLKRAASLGFGIAKTQVNKYHAQKNQRRYIFVSHPIDNTGAPLVLLQIIKEFAEKYGGQHIQLITPDIKPPELRMLQELGVKVDKAALGLSFRLIRLQLGLRKNDFVLMNTAAIYDNYRDFILLWLRNQRLKHAFWFIHEDQAQLPVIHKEFLEKRNLDHTSKLMKVGKLTLLVPSERTKDEYTKLLKSNNIRTINLSVEVDDKYKKPRKAADYETINFLLSGTPSDGRKGQLLAISAFYYFIQNYYEKDPEKYRKFSLHLLAIGEDYISKQIKWIGKTFLSNHLNLYPSVPKSKALEISAKCNAVICCSLNETFGLYIAEGMSMGHVVLRNNSAGMDEQLKQGVNGYFIDHTDIKQFASIIEKILNIKVSPNDKLAKMGQASQKIIGKYSKNTYIKQIV